MPGTESVPPSRQHVVGSRGTCARSVVGITADLTERGLGVRSGRYSMVVNDGVVKSLNVEDAPGKADISGADNLLKGL